MIENHFLPTRGAKGLAGVRSHRAGKRRSHCLKARDSRIVIVIVVVIVIVMVTSTRSRDRDER